MKALAAVAVAMLLPLAFATTAWATPTTVDLNTASSFAVLAAAGVSDVPTSQISGNVGLSPGPGSAITGVTCAAVTGTIYAVDATGLPCFVSNPGLLTTADNDLTNAYIDAAGRMPDSTFVGVDNQLGGQTLVAGVYKFGHAATANLIGNLTLSGNADAVWIFQATSDLVTAASSTVTLTGGAQACNVFWQVGSSATLHTSSTLRGTVLANTSISVDGSVTVIGRLLAGAQAPSGAVTLIQDTITKPTTCVTQASIDSAAAAALAQTQAQAAAEAQAASDRATAAAKEAADRAAAIEADKAAVAAKAVADKAAADKAAADKAAADVAAAAAAKAVSDKAAAAKAVKAVNAAKAAKAKRAKAVAVKAAVAKAIKLKRASVRAAVVSAGFTG